MSKQAKGTPPKFQSSQDYGMKSTIQTPNRFQTLNDFPPLTYSMALETPSFKLQTQTPLPKSTPPKPITATTSNASSQNSYFTKPHFETLVLSQFTEIPDFKSLTNLLQKIFSPGCQWLPDDPLKTQQFYELILVDSNSVSITHTPDRSDPTKIAFSKCIINKVIKPSEWVSIWSTRSFLVKFIPQMYTYQDYRMAWYRTFFKRPFDHSWFFIFNQECLKDFPIWFFEWWLFFRSTQDILPPVPKLGFQTWTKYRTDLKPYNAPVQFHAEFRVPWIFCWSFKIQQVYSKEYPMSLIREFKIKWWPTFSVEMCSQEVVLQFIQTGTKLKKAIHSLPKDESTSTAVFPTKQKLGATDADEEAFKEFLQFKKFQAKLKSSIPDSDSSQGSSFDPFGGPLAQDPFE